MTFSVVIPEQWHASISLVDHKIACLAIADLEDRILPELWHQLSTIADRRTGMTDVQGESPKMSQVSNEEETC